MIFPFLFGIFVAKMCDATGFGLILGCALDIIGLHWIWIWIWIGFHWIWMEKNGQKEKKDWSRVFFSDRIWRKFVLENRNGSSAPWWLVQQKQFLAFPLVAGAGISSHFWPWPRKSPLLISTVSVFARMVRKWRSGGLCADQEQQRHVSRATSARKPDTLRAGEQ